MKKLALPLVAACWLLLAAAPLSAQGPAADWRRLETAHYRFSYPAAAEDFTRHIAARLEAIRERVAAEVGYRSEDRTEVLVIDPLAAANGSAWPLQGWPRLILFATPPGPDSLLGHFDDWSTLLGLHEATHLAHLLRPSRQKAEARLGALVPLGPLTRRAPRWVIEGYATYLEGQLSGYGRPQGDYRPALLRRWAQLGYLPAYGELNGAPRRFLGGSFAYLVGSAFLEWLVAREGDDSLRHLWARLSAKEGRDFDSAFAGVFGDNPANLYRRFCAELTYQAMLAEAEQALSPGRGSELWQKLGGRPSPPSQSADGEKLAVVLHPLGEPARLVVYATAADAEAAQRDQQRRAKLQQRDPEDVPAVRRDPLPAKVLHELRAKSGGDFLDPRFFADGSALLLSRLEPADDGRLIPDLYRFDLARGALRRLTVGAGLRDADPLPDGRRAIALRYQYGRAELLLVDLESGGETRLEAPPFPTALAQPKVAPDGRSLALLAHRDGAWRLEIRPLDPVEGQIGADRGVDLPPAATITDPAFSTDGRYLYATVGSGGQLDLYRFELAGSGRLGPGERLTREPGAAFAAAPGPREVYFLALEAEGFNLRRLTPAIASAAANPAPAPNATTREAARVLVERRDAIAAAPLTEAALPPSRPYGGGPLELLPLVAGGSGPDGPSYELGLRAGDPVGRRELLLALSSGQTRGASLFWRWRGWPYALGVDLFDFEEGDPVDKTRGLALSLGRTWTRRTWQADFELGAAYGERGQEAAREERIYTRAGIAWGDDRGTWRFGAGARIAATYGNQERSADFHLGRISSRLEIAREPFGGRPLELGLEAGIGRASGDATLFTLGGRHATLLPSAFFAERLEQPGLPAGILQGRNFDRIRLDLRATRWPLRLFGERYRFAHPSAATEELRLWGLELTHHLPAQPFLRLPELDLRAGILEILEGPQEDERELYFSLAWRP